MLIITIIEFLFFSFLGWAIDSGYRSITEKRFINAGYFKGPICPIYGFGGLGLIFVLKYFDFLPLVLLLLAGTSSLILVEYLGGIFTEKVLKMKLWDYSSSRFHLGGHIDILHSGYWLLLTILFYYFVFPLAGIFEKTAVVPEFVELPLFLAFVLTALWLTTRKIPSQFLDYHEKFINITVERYQKVYSTIRELYHTHSAMARRQLEQKLRQQLENTGAYLKKVRGRVKEEK